MLSGCSRETVILHDKFSFGVAVSSIGCQALVKKITAHVVARLESLARAFYIFKG